MGGVFALYLIPGTHFSISGAVGFVSVFGVAVQDGVLLVTYCNQMECPRIFGLGEPVYAAPSSASDWSS